MSSPILNPPSPLSSRARKRLRQKQNQKLRASTALDEALQSLRRYPSLSNALQGWLAYLLCNGSAQEYNSASNLVRVFKKDCIRSSGIPNFCENQLLSSDLLSFTVHEFAGSFILDKNIERPSKIARIGCNFCSFVFFLGKFHIMPDLDILRLHDYCSDLGLSMIRSSRAERVGEAYSSYVREAYDDSNMTEDVENVSLFHGGFEVAFVGKRFCLLQDWAESGLKHAAFRKFDPVKVRFPLPMTKQLKPGDHLHLEIRRIKGSSIWVPTECYGVYPEGADQDESQIASSATTPTEQSEYSGKEDEDVGDVLQLLDAHYQPLAEAYDKLKSRGEDTAKLIESMAKLDTTLSDIRAGFTWKQLYAERTMEDLSPDGFNEPKFTDHYFSSMEIDIGDHDQGFGIFEDDSDHLPGDGDETE